MARFDLSVKTPVPIITDYSKIINARRTADLSGGSNDGPFSSLFDYTQEKVDLEAEHQKKEKTQQKIMRTNALGDAFRLIMEGAGAAAGATITKRNVNPGILSAVNEYSKNDLDYINRLEGLKTKKLALGQADLQYKLGQDAAALAKVEKQAERSHDEALQTAKELDNFIRENKILEKTYRLRGMENEAEAARKQTQSAIEQSLAIELARKKAEFDRGIGLSGGADPSSIDVITSPKKGDTKTIEFITPDTKKKIYLTPGMVNYIRTQLQTGKGKYDQTVPKVLRDAMANEAIKPESLYTAISDSWDYVRDNILPPGVYSQIYGGEPGQETETSSPETTATQSATGVPANVEELQQKIFTNLTTDTALDLEDNKSVKKKIGELSDLIYGNYLLQPGNKKTKNDAVTEANKVITKYRQLVRIKGNPQ
jgi:hypothetical protein